MRALRLSVLCDNALCAPLSTSPPLAPRRFAMAVMALAAVLFMVAPPSAAVNCDQAPWKIFTDFPNVVVPLGGPMKQPPRAECNATLATINIPADSSIQAVPNAITVRVVMNQAKTQIADLTRMSLALVTPGGTVIQLVEVIDEVFMWSYPINASFVASECDQYVNAPLVTSIQPGYNDPKSPFDSNFKAWGDLSTVMLGNGGVSGPWGLCACHRDHSTDYASESRPVLTSWSINFFKATPQSVVNCDAAPYKTFTVPINTPVPLADVYHDNEACYTATSTINIVWNGTYTAPRAAAIQIDMDDADLHQLEATLITPDMKWVELGPVGAALAPQKDVQARFLSLDCQQHPNVPAVSASDAPVAADGSTLRTWGANFSLKDIMFAMGPWELRVCDRTPMKRQPTGMLKSWTVSLYT